MFSFGQALEKLSFKLNQKGKQEVKAERHFETSDPNWNEFVKNLKSKHFQDAVKGHPQADEKLQAYVENFGGYLRSKDHVATLKSKDSGKNYRIKRVGKRLGCNCGDWQYKHSVQGGDCKHIKSLRQSKMLKTAAMDPEKLEAMRRKRDHRQSLLTAIPPAVVGLVLGARNAHHADVPPYVLGPVMGLSMGAGTYLGSRYGLKKSREKRKTAGLPGALLTVYKYPELLGPDAKKHKKKIEKKVDEVLVPLELAKEAFVKDLITAAATVSAMNAAAERKKRHGQAAAMNAKQLREQPMG